MNKLLQELKDVLSEYGFAQRWAEIEKWYHIGRILNESTVTELEVSKIALELEESENNLWNAILFARQYKDLSMFPSGKNTSWNKIKDEL